MKITFLGTGTSHGIPVIGCDCAVCRSSDPRNRRHRCSLYVQSGEGTSRDTAVLVDTGPEFRIQCIEHQVRRLDAVFLTHSHADHLHGIDDLRIFSYTLRESVRDKFPQLEPLPVFTNQHTKQDIEKRFGYIFTPVKEGGGKPNLALYSCDTCETVTIGPCDIQSVPLLHGTLETSGWIFRETRYVPEQGSGFTAARDRNIPMLSATIQQNDDIPETSRNTLHAQNGKLLASYPENAERAARGVAYLTDCSAVPEQTVAAAQGVEHLIIDGLRMKPHNTHFSFSQALETAEKIHPHHVWLIHINHERSHAEIDDYLQKEKIHFPHLADIEVHPAYDGLSLFL